jgi:hypothetical protein
MTILAIPPARPASDGPGPHGDGGDCHPVLTLEIRRGTDGTHALHLLLGAAAPIVLGGSVGQLAQMAGAAIQDVLTGSLSALTG